MGSEESELIYRARDACYTLIYSPDAVMYHIIPRKRMSLTYLLLRYFGQGRVDFRFDISVRNKTLNRKSFKRDVKTILYTLYKATILYIKQNKTARVEALFSVFSHAGRVFEYIRHTLRRLKKRKTGAI